ncbi:MAG: HEAT repeat domain-containing protein [Isosphaeraceae bacterium]
MRSQLTLAVLIATLAVECRDAFAQSKALPAPAAGWSIELAAAAPEILYPTAIVAALDGSVYIGSDPMDMPGPPTVPIDRVIRLKEGRITVFAENLWSVMGLEWIDGTLYVVHAPFLSALRDTDGDGLADTRVDLVTGLGPTLPGWSGINEHVASGVRLGMDGFLYVAIGDKGIPRATGRDGKTIQLHGGGVIRVRPDGTDLEIVSTGERNPLSVALSATDEVFTYGNDDDSKTWPNSLTHHIVGGHYGYPYQFRITPQRALPIMSGEFGGAGAQAICYNEDGLPAEFRGNLFLCDWGLQTVFRLELRKSGGTFAVARRTPLVTKGEVADFRPFSMAVAGDRASLYLVDWAYNGWLDAGARTGRLYRLRRDELGQAAQNRLAQSREGEPPGEPIPQAARTEPRPPRITKARSEPRPGARDDASLIAALDHPALSVRLESQRGLARRGRSVVPLLVERLKQRKPAFGRLHALWALDEIGGDLARGAIGSMLADPVAQVRLQAARSTGIRGQRAALPALTPLLDDRDPAVRREAAIALGKLGDLAAAPALYKALGDSDKFAAWSIRQAIRRLGAWDKDALVQAIKDDRRREPALLLTDEAWNLTVVEALCAAFQATRFAPVRAMITANLAGLYRQYPDWDGTWFGTNPVAGPAPRKTKDWSSEGMNAVLAGLAVSLTDPDRRVRAEAIGGMSQAGLGGAPLLRASLRVERDPDNQAALADALGQVGDIPSVPLLAALLLDAGRSESVRMAALEGLARLRDRKSLQARLALVFDSKSSADLVARALPDLAREGYLPPNELASFFENPAPAVRSAAILSLNVKKGLPADLHQAVLDRLDDQAASVRGAAMMAAVGLHMRAAVPRLLAIARDPNAPDRLAAIAALCRLPDPAAIPVYLAAIKDRDPSLRRAGEKALAAIRDKVAGDLAAAAKDESTGSPAGLALERVLARFEPIRTWRVIGPFPRTTPQIFLGERSIDFHRPVTGALGRPVSWAARSGDATTGRVDLEDLKQRAEDNGGFGYDKSGAPDLCAFAYAEVDVDRASPALLLLGSSGSLLVTVNEKLVHQYADSGGRAFEADSDGAKIELVEGRNRILVLSRQGIGPWCFSVQLARLGRDATAPRPPALSRISELRRYAMETEGDPRKGERLFFDVKRAGCAQCHAVGARGTSTIGPNLAGLALTYDRAELVRSVLEPSARIAPGHQSVVLATRAGKVMTGVIRAETDQDVVLADWEAKITRIPKADIAQRRSSDVSIMPAKAAESLSPEEFADLIGYLASLKDVPRAARLRAGRTGPGTEGSNDRGR